MNLEDKYPTLEQSKRIAELLGKNAPESERWWICDTVGGMDEPLIRSTYAEYVLGFEGRIEDEDYPAYDLAELGEIIWDLRFPYQPHSEISAHRTHNGWSDNIGTNTVFPTEAQARAALLIHLLESQKD